MSLGAQIETVFRSACKIDPCKPTYPGDHPILSRAVLAPRASSSTATLAQRTWTCGPMNDTRAPVSGTSITPIATPNFSSRALMVLPLDPTIWGIASWWTGSSICVALSTPSREDSQVQSPLMVCWVGGGSCVDAKAFVRVLGTSTGTDFRAERWLSGTPRSYSPSKIEMWSHQGLSALFSLSLIAKSVIATSLFPVSCNRPSRDQRTKEPGMVTVVSMSCANPLSSSVRMPMESSQPMSESGSIAGCFVVAANAASSRWLDRGPPRCHWNTDPWLAEAAPSSSVLWRSSKSGKRSLRAAAAGSPISPRRKRRGVSVPTDPDPEVRWCLCVADDEPSPRPRPLLGFCEGFRWRGIVLQLQNAPVPSLLVRLTFCKVLRAPGEAKKAPTDSYASDMVSYSILKPWLCE